MNIQTIVFDLGGVLIDWNPRYLYRKLLRSEEEIEYFLSHICTPEWNAQQDAGRPFREGVALLKQQYPQYAELIDAYVQRWEETLGDAHWETVEVLREVKQMGMPVYALTNWSAETFPVARKKFDFLNWFDGILVSGEVRLKKPDPAIFRLLMEKYPINASRTIYIDDVKENIIAADHLGFRTIHFHSAVQLRTSLRELGFVQLRE
jgi:2-haloacid dehalogenase